MEPTTSVGAAGGPEAGWRAAVDGGDAGLVEDADAGGGDLGLRVAMMSFFDE